MSYYLHGSIQFMKALIGQEVQVNRAGSKQHLQPCKTNVLQNKALSPRLTAPQWVCSHNKQSK